MNPSSIPVREASHERSDALGLSFGPERFHPRNMAEFFGPMDQIELACVRAVSEHGAPERSVLAHSQTPFYLFDAGGLELLITAPPKERAAQGRSVWIGAGDLFMGPREAHTHYKSLGREGELLAALTALSQTQPGFLRASREAEALEREAPAASARASRPGI